jgi:ABC-2 type transport system ATP-binding protein
VEQICDQVAVIDRGRLVAQGPLAEVAAGRDLETMFLDLTGEGNDHGPVAG